jgi:hypothetical protein
VEDGMNMLEEKKKLEKEKEEDLTSELSEMIIQFIKEGYEG